MTRATKRIGMVLLAAVVGWFSMGSEAKAAPYFITVTGTPSIKCVALDGSNTGVQITGVSLEWQLRSTASAADGTLYINGAFSAASTLAPGAIQGNATGTATLSGGNLSYPATPFPYTLKFDVVPQESYTDGVTVTFTCNSATVFSNWSVTTIPARIPVFHTTPSPVNFAATDVGGSSAATTVTVTNDGTADATALTLSNSNGVEFSISGNTCTGPLAKNASCTFAASFRPVATGARAASVQIADADGATVSLQLKGAGTGPQLGMQPSVAFGNQTVGTTSAPTNVTVTNVGTAAATVSAVSSGNATEFPVTSTCATLAPGATCTIAVRFAPGATGARATTVTVASNGAGNPQTIAVGGTGTPAAAGGQLSVPATAAFGTQVVGTPSSPLVVNIANTGGSPVTVASVVSSAPAEFAATTTCATVAAGGACTLTLTFTPAAVGARAATITVTSNGIGSPQTLSATGTGSATPVPGQLAIAGSAAFGSVVVGSGSTPATLVLTNVGGVPVAVASIGSSNPTEFAISGSTCGSVAGGASCEFSVTFIPAAVGERSATITIASSGAGSPQAVSASGTGVATPPATADLIEYHHAEWDHYFMTSIPDEITKLDNGVFAGWARTGYKFKSYALATSGSANVCRFFSTSFAPRSSHFYTPFANECTVVKANRDWSFEGDVFGIPVPTLAGVCPAGTVPVYRLYNNGQGAAPNHRYTTDLAVRAQMIANGWVPEGYGDLGVIMCAPV